MTDSLGHYCGIVGIYSDKEINMPEKLFYPLFGLQHRGQETAGIAYQNSEGLHVYKDRGLVARVLAPYLQQVIPAHVGIAHVRYSTHGGKDSIENAQPMTVDCNKGRLAIAHNGNLSNSRKLHQDLVAEGSIFQGTSDTEIIPHMIARSREDDFISALIETLKKLEGAYSLVMIHEGKLIAARDPFGFRPLLIGEKDGLFITASESNALEILGIHEYRSIKPGELIVIDDEGMHSYIINKQENYAQCIFELIYFARPDSRIYEKSVHLCRKKMGQELASLDKNLGDVVMPVPDSGNSAALGYSEAANIPFELGLTRNHFSPRSFIMPTKRQRELAVSLKLHPIKEVIEGKRVILVDDSLVRGTTSRILVDMVRKAGAKEIHLRLSSPEIVSPCYFGIDIPTSEELISNHKTAAEIARFIGADSVKFLPLENLRRCVKNPKDFCYGCFTGTYPIPGN